MLGAVSLPVRTALALGAEASPPDRVDGDAARPGEHPDRRDRVRDQLGQRGAPLTDNYGWPTNLTYAQAAAALDATIAGMRAYLAIGRRLRDFMIYAAHDLRPAGTTR